MKFDLIIGNISGDIGVEVIKQTHNIATDCVIITPATWLLKDNNKRESHIDLKYDIQDSLKSVEMFNGNPIFNVGMNTPLAIYHFVNPFIKTSVKYFDDKRIK